MKRWRTMIGVDDSCFFDMGSMSVKYLSSTKTEHTAQTITRRAERRVKRGLQKKKKKKEQGVVCGQHKHDQEEDERRNGRGEEE